MLQGLTERLLGPWRRRNGGDRGQPLESTAGVTLPFILLASSGVLLAAPVVYRLLARHRRQREQRFEYGPLDLSHMTVQAARQLHGVPPRGERQKVSAQARTSLIPEALQDLEESGGSLASDALAPGAEVDQRAQALSAVGAPPFKLMLQDKAGVKDFVRGPCRTLQLNIGLYCNQACNHCHVESSPLRKEMMSQEVVDRCLHLLRMTPSVSTLDITGGAPELNSGFRRLVEGAAALRDSGVRPELRIIDRCNLTVLLEPGQEYLAEFLAAQRVDVIASLPSYDAAQTDRQRGRKVFERSIEALRILNSHGYGTDGAKSQENLRLDLVFNPPGPFLPPRQDLLEAKYRQELGAVQGVHFNHLIAIANMPIKRYFDELRKKGMLEGYMDLLVRNFNPETVPNLMCVDTVSVGWDGRLFDCDFNQQLELTVGRRPLSVFDVDSLDDERLRKVPIVTAAHCFGCTAAQGSSCQGALGRK